MEGVGAKMAIKKQEYYEGAALHQLARRGQITAIRYTPPFFLINKDLAVLLKHSTKGRSSWGFTFMPDEQLLLHTQSTSSRLIIGLICGADGVVAIPYDSYRAVAALRNSSL